MRTSAAIAALTVGLGGCSLYFPVTLSPSDRPVDTRFGTARAGTSAKRPPEARTDSKADPQPVERVPELGAAQLAVADRLPSLIGECVRLVTTDNETLNGSVSGFDGEFVYLEIGPGQVTRIGIARVGLLEPVGSPAPVSSPPSGP